jgi:hypothetical protein
MAKKLQNKMFWDCVGFLGCMILMYIIIVLAWCF